MNSILQGTTPTLKISILEDIPVATITALELTFRHKNTVRIKHLADVTLDNEENTISYHFSEQETLALDPVSPLEWQLRLQTTEGIVGTPKAKIGVMDLISTETIQ